MSTALISSKGQLTIPAAVRAELHVSSGDRIEFVKVAEGRFELVAFNQDIKQLKGLVKVSRAISLAQMDAAIHKGASD